MQPLNFSQVPFETSDRTTRERRWRKRDKMRDGNKNRKTFVALIQREDLLKKIGVKKKRKLFETERKREKTKRNVAWCG